MQYAEHSRMQKSSKGSDVCVCVCVCVRVRVCVCVLCVYVWKG